MKFITFYGIIVLYYKRGVAMYLNILNLNININNENYMVNMKANDTCINIYNGVFLKLHIEQNSLGLSLLNTSDESVTLKNLSFEAFRFVKEDFDYVLNYKDSLEDPIEILKISAKIPPSYMFTSLFSRDYANFLIGFLGTHHSFNSIIFSQDKNSLYVCPNYDFINYNLQSNEELFLDPIYFSLDINYFNMLSGYIDTILKIYNRPIGGEFIKIYNTEKRLQTSMLFTKDPENFSLKCDKKFLKERNLNLYPIDITCVEGKNQILLFIKENAKNNLISLNNLSEYIDIIKSKKLFNVYHEFNKLLSFIQSNYPSLVISTKGGPLGLLCGHKFAFNNTNCYVKKSFLNKYNYNFDYQYIINSLLYRLLYIHNDKYIIKNSKSKELLELFMNYNSRQYTTNSLYKEIASCIEKSNLVIPHLYKDNVFGFLVHDNMNYYMAIFNFSSKTSSFYWDFSNILKDVDFSGILEDTLSHQQLAVASNSLSIKRLPSMECMLFKKSFSSEECKNGIA